MKSEPSTQMSKTKSFLKSGAAIVVALAALFLYRMVDDDSRRPTTRTVERRAPHPSSTPAGDVGKRAKRQGDRTAPPSDGLQNPKVYDLFKRQQSDVFVTVDGRVKFLLPDDTKGSKHQRFVIDVGNDHTLLVAHNIDLAPRVPVKKGEKLRLRGEYEFTAKGGVLHFTHKPSRGSGEGGWIEYAGKRFD